MISSYQEKEKGLTIIELLATIAILVSAIMVILVLGDRAISQAGFYSAQTQATFLAKEGMEIVTDEIEEVINNTFSETTYWNADYVDGVQPKDATACYSKLMINVAGYYSYTSGDSSAFSRCITAVDTGSAIEVVVDVAFDYRGINNIKLYRIFTY